MCRADQPEAVRELLVPALVKGFASHHAGLLPGWKGLVESLFQKGAALSTLPLLIQHSFMQVIRVFIQSSHH